MKEFEDYVKFLEIAEKEGAYLYGKTGFVEGDIKEIDFIHYGHLDFVNFKDGLLKNITKQVPLGFKDMKPGMMFSRKKESHICRCFISQICGEHILISGSVRVSYKDLFDEYEYSTDGENWRDCSKDKDPL